MIDDLRNGKGDIPEHGTLATIRQTIPADRLAGILPPEEATEAPVWLARNDDSTEDAS